MVVVVVSLDKLAVAVEVAASLDKLAGAVEVEVDLPEAGSLHNREAATANKEVAAADMEGACPEGHAICNNHNSIPTTSRRLAESKPIDNNCRTNSLPPRTPA